MEISEVCKKMVFHPPVAIVAKAGDAGKYKVGLPAWNMVIRGFMSGAYIAMGGALATVCSTGIAYSAAQITREQFLVVLHQQVWHS